MEFCLFDLILKKYALFLGVEKEKIETGSFPLLWEKKKLKKMKMLALTLSSSSDILDVLHTSALAMTF